MILITGCARSGTSLSAGIFRACGAEFGKVNGNVEHGAVRDGLVKPYLSRQGYDPLCQDPLPEIDRLAPWESLADDFRAAVEPGVNAYKGAKMCLMWPIWAKAFPGAKWVIVRRDRGKIASSCMRTGFMSRRHTLDSWGEWVDTHLERFEEMRESLGAVEVWPVDFVQHGKEAGMRAAVEHCGLTWDRDAARKVILPGRFHG